MNRQDIANILKMRRKELKISVSDVICYLSQNGFDVKMSTIYGWENGRRMPDIDQFVILCRLYGIDNLTDNFALSANQGSIFQNKKENDPNATKVAHAYMEAEPRIQNAVCALLGLPIPNEEEERKNA